MGGIGYGKGRNVKGEGEQWGLRGMGKGKVRNEKGRNGEWELEGLGIRRGGMGNGTGRNGD